MSWIKVISEAEAAGELAEIYHQVGSAKGRVANITKITSLKPEVTRALVQLRQAVRSSAKLSTRRQEMIATVASALNQCSY